MIQIIVPVYNGLDLLKRCVLAVRQNTHVDYELIIADDHSPDTHVMAYCKKEKLRVVQNGSGVQGFPHNCNWAAKESKSEFICLLNSDTEVKSGWLEAMLDEMDEPSVGIVGAKLIYPLSKEGPWGGTIQHAGVAFNASGQPYHIHRGKNPRARCVNVLTECNAVTFACVLIRREVWDQLEGLDEGFVGGQFEDIDFCLRAREKGWRVIYTPRAVALHLEHGAGEEFVLQTAPKNAARLVKKWGKIPSDEYLFQSDALKGLWVPEKLEQLAEVCSYWRAQQLGWVADRRDIADNLDHCKRLSQIPYAKLPDVEKEYARAMAKNILRMAEKILEGE